MNDPTPATLDRLWDEIPTGEAPVAELLAAGQARTRHRRRAVVVAAAAATVLAVGVGALLARGTTVDDGLVGEGPTHLDVRVTYGSSPAARGLDLTMGEAGWDEADHALVYVSRAGWSGSCPPEGTATASREGLELELAEPGGGGVCTTDARSVTATITGLEQPPAQLQVVDGGAVRTVVVEVPNPGEDHGDLTDEEYAAAVRVAQEQLKGQEATVTSATVRASAGTTSNSNVGYECTSGRLLHIKLIGTFPHIVTPVIPQQPGSDPEDTVVHALVVTADAASGRACLVGVQTGDVSPPKNAVTLDLG